MPKECARRQGNLWKTEIGSFELTANHTDDSGKIIIRQENFILQLFSDEKESEDRIQNSEYPMPEVRGNNRKEFFLLHDSVALASPRAS